MCTFKFSVLQVFQAIYETAIFLEIEAVSILLFMCPGAGEELSPRILEISICTMNQRQNHQTKTSYFKNVFLRRRL